MDTATRVQILDETVCISQCTNTLEKGMDPIILPPAILVVLWYDNPSKKKKSLNSDQLNSP